MNVQMKELKLGLGNLNCRSVIRAFLCTSCCAKSDTTFVVNALSKVFNIPGTIYFRYLLHPIGYIKNASSKGLKFYTEYEKSHIYKLLQHHNIIFNDNKIIITFSDSF